MLIDLSVELTKDATSGDHDFFKGGHIGTHFDAMGAEFGLDYLILDAVAFNVSGVAGRDVEAADIDLDAVKKGDFVAFYTAWLAQYGYGSERYFKDHPQLSDALIDALLERGVKIIGIDCAGVRRGKEHTPKDAYCAEHGAFVVENLDNLDRVLGGQKSRRFKAYTFPLRYSGLTGLPSRVVAEI